MRRAERATRDEPFVNVPLLDRETARRSAVKRLVRQLFADSPGSLALNVLENEQVDAEEVTHLLKLLNETE